MACCLSRPHTRVFDIPVFLAPAFSVSAPHCAAKSFSTSAPAYTQVRRGNRDKNKNRGVSVIRSTGFKHRLPYNLPQPVADTTAARAEFKLDPEHGLWGFFNKAKEPIIPPAEEDAHGRAWTMRELSKRSWDDLHKLYWISVKELNIVRTRDNERKRLRVGHGQRESEERIKAIVQTMRLVRQTLTLRHFAHFDAQQLLHDKNLYELFPDILIDRISTGGPDILSEEASDSHFEASASSLEDPVTSSEAAKDPSGSSDIRPRQKVTE